MKTNVFLFNNGFKPLSDEYPLLKDTTTICYCQLCGNKTQSHFCMTKSMYGLSIFILCLFAYLWIKIQIHRYKNKK